MRKSYAQYVLMLFSLLSILGGLHTLSSPLMMMIVNARSTDRFLVIGIILNGFALIGIYLREYFGVFAVVIDKLIIISVSIYSHGITSLFQ